MNDTAVKTYRVRFELRTQGALRRQVWFAIDQQGNWRCKGDAAYCVGQSGMDLARSLFHAEEIHAVEVIDDVTYADIIEF